MKTYRPKSFVEYVGIIDNLQKKSKNPLWFRGCGSENYPLTPSLFRHSTTKKIKDLIELEYKLMTRFKQRSIPFRERIVEDEWEQLFFMQHCGVPTRLLDWTENPFIGFYFAVMSAKFKIVKKKLSFQNSACVWILDPFEWNKHSLSDVSYEGGIMNTNDDQIKSYKPTPKLGSMNEHAIAIYGVHNSARIVAQRGVFTIFGKSMLPMEDSHAKFHYPVNSLVKIVLNKSKLEKMRESILQNGITESVVFPDLDGLAREIKRFYKFDN